MGWQNRLDVEMVIRGCLPQYPRQFCWPIGSNSNIGEEFYPLGRGVPESPLHLGDFASNMVNFHRPIPQSSSSMICVTLGRARHTKMINEHKELSEQGAELVELRTDYIGRAISLKRLLENRPTPVVITARRREDGGRWLKSEDERMTLLRSAIAAGVEYVDIEADVAAQIPRYGPPNGGRWLKSEDERMTLLRSAIAAGVEYVDGKRSKPT